jgi:hypothetical protein
VKPELGQRREYDGEISSTVGGKKSGNVLNEDEPAIGPRTASAIRANSKKRPDRSPASPRSSSGDGEVLAGESSAEEVKRTMTRRNAPSALHVRGSFQLIPSPGAAAAA